MEESNSCLIDNEMVFDQGLCPGADGLKYPERD